MALQKYLIILVALCFISIIHNLEVTTMSGGSHENHGESGRLAPADHTVKEEDPNKWTPAPSQSATTWRKIHQRYNAVSYWASLCDNLLTSWGLDTAYNRTVFSEDLATLAIGRTKVIYWICRTNRDILIALGRKIRWTFTNHTSQWIPTARSQIDSSLAAIAAKYASGIGLGDIPDWRLLKHKVAARIWSAIGETTNIFRHISSAWSWAMQWWISAWSSRSTQLDPWGLPFAQTPAQASYMWFNHLLDFLGLRTLWAAYLHVQQAIVAILSLTLGIGASLLIGLCLLVTVKVIKWVWWIWHNLWIELAGGVRDRNE